MEAKAFNAAIFDKTGPSLVSSKKASAKALASCSYPFLNKLFKYSS